MNISFFNFRLIPNLGLLRTCFLAISLASVSNIASAEKIADLGDMVHIAAGTYTPLYKQSGVVKDIQVEPFYLDKYQVTNREFSQFISAHPKWQQKNIPSIFADQSYLSQLQNVVDENSDEPVTNVSWYAAMAYCKAQGKTLPSVDQWEFVAQASDVSANGTKELAFRQKILEWYSKPTSATGLPNVQDTQTNFWGVHGMHGVVWEMVKDFNNTLVSGESRGDSSLDRQLFCGAGAAAAVDPSDYAAFMRYAFRSSYEAKYTVSSLGFRCAKNI